MIKIFPIATASQLRAFSLCCFPLCSFPQCSFQLGGLIGWTGVAPEERGGALE